VVELEVVEVELGDKKFQTTYGLYQQAQELRGTLYAMPNSKVNAHGEGLFQEMLLQGKKAGWPV